MPWKTTMRLKGRKHTDVKLYQEINIKLHQRVN